MLLATEDSPNRNLEDTLLGGGASTLTQLSRSIATATRVDSGASSQVTQHRLLQILNSIDFVESQAEVPSWEVFDASQVNQVLISCERVTPVGERSIDIPRLHKILSEELSSLQGAAALSQRQVIQNEIKR
jgi:hypothetical protein